MIRARHSALTALFFDRYIDGLIRSQFSHYFLVNELPDIRPERGLILLPNHISWWDGFFIYSFLRKRTQRRIHLMMLEEQLSRFRFFAGLGAYSIAPGTRCGVIESIEYTRSILADPRNCAIVYPQGEIRPFWERPFRLGHGVRAMVGKQSIGITVLPVAYCITPCNEKKPEIYLRFGVPLDTESVDTDFGALESAFTENADACARAVNERQFVRDIITRL